MLSGGRIVAEHDVAAFRAAGSASLEETFVRATGQEDVTPLAARILDVVRRA